MGKCIDKMVSHKLDILAIGVHPDDVELACMGTLLLQKSKGHRVGILDLTKGELGSNGSAEIRMQEVEASNKITGITVRENLGMRDGFFAHNERSLLRIIEKIRKYQPEIVLANSLSDRHPDHGRAAKLIADACYYSGLTKIKTSNQVHWRPKSVYHYIQDYNLTPDIVVDVTPFFDTKIASIQAFKTQFFSGEGDNKNTPISSETFLEFIKAKMRTFGRPINVKYAEGFNVNRTVGTNDLMHLL